MQRILVNLRVSYTEIVKIAPTGGMFLETPNK